MRMRWTIIIALAVTAVLIVGKACKFKDDEESIFYSIPVPIDEIPEGYEGLADFAPPSKRGVLHQHPYGSRPIQRDLTLEEELAIRYLASPQFLRQDADTVTMTDHKGWPICIIDGETFEIYHNDELYNGNRGRRYFWKAEGACWKNNEQNGGDLDLSPLVEWYKEMKDD